VFLFFKEALANVQRHAKASRVELSARVLGHTFELRIQDDGQGFDTTAKSTGMGMSSLYERARRLGGTCEFASSPSGSAVTLRVPIPASP
jgi:signal transduction histidine kinase